MQSLFSFIVKPKKERYDNKKYIDGQELLLNTEISDHRYVSRTAIVIALPKSYTGEIQINDEVIVHHNLFRRWYNAHGIENNSSGYYKEDQYFVGLDQMYLYKRKNKWKPLKGFCFVKPIESNNIIEKEQPHIGIIKYVDKNLKGIQKEDLVGFTPNSKYEFIINGERLYRVLTKFITIKYERQGTETEYNPSW